MAGIPSQWVFGMARDVNFQTLTRKRTDHRQRGGQIGIKYEDFVQVLHGLNGGFGQVEGMRDRSPSLLEISSSTRLSRPPGLPAMRQSSSDVAA